MITDSAAAVALDPSNDAPEPTPEAEPEPRSPWGAFESHAHARARLWSDLVRAGIWVGDRWLANWGEAHGVRPERLVAIVKDLAKSKRIAVRPVRDSRQIKGRALG